MDFRGDVEPSPVVCTGKDGGMVGDGGGWGVETFVGVMGGDDVLGDGFGQAEVA